MAERLDALAPVILDACAEDSWAVDARDGQHLVHHHEREDRQAPDGIPCACRMRLPGARPGPSASVDAGRRPPRDRRRMGRLLQDWTSARLTAISYRTGPTRRASLRTDHARRRFGTRASFAAGNFAMKNHHPDAGISRYLHPTTPGTTKRLYGPNRPSLGPSLCTN